MKLTNWKNIAPRNALSRTIDDFFTDTYRRLLDEPRVDDEAFSVPAVNVAEGKKSFDLQLAAPGMKREDFDISVDNGVMTIRAEHADESGQEEKEFMRKEFSYRVFQRSFSLPENVEEDQIKATYKDGILHLDIPKRPGADQAEKVKKIKVG